MTRTALTLLTYNSNEYIDVSSAATVDATNGMACANAFNVKNGTTRIVISNTASSNKAIILKSGDFVTGLVSSDYSLTIPAGKTYDILVNMLESRVKRQDGSLYIDFESGFEGKIYIAGEASHMDAA